jgi:hypothetical protein
MGELVDPAIRAAYEAGGGKLLCQFCKRKLTLKPGGMRGYVVFPHHNVARRVNRLEPVPLRCRGSGIAVRIETDEEVCADNEAFLEELAKSPAFAIRGVTSCGPP